VFLLGYQHGTVLDGAYQIIAEISTVDSPSIPGDGSVQVGPVNCQLIGGLLLLELIIA
jgi:hypothetical protein